MKKMRFLVCGFVVLVASIALIGSLQGMAQAQPKSIEIGFMHYFPPVHFVHTKIVQPWTKMMEEKSGGKLKFKVYPSAALAKPNDFLEAVTSGGIDIVMGYAGFHPGRFPVAEVSGLPFLNYTSVRCASKTYLELYKTVPEFAKDWQGVKVLWFQTEPPMQLHTSKKPIRTLGDLKGVKLKISGQPAPYLNSLGATSIVMASPEVYDALSKGVIDGTIYPWEAIKGWNLQEMSYYHTWLNFFANPFYVVMNLEKWKSLPPDIKTLIDRYSGDYGTEFAAKVWDQGNNEAYEMIKKDSKHEIITLPKSDQEKAIELMKPHYDKWIASVAAKGIDGKPILEKTRAYAKRFAD
jgi:TRAP-type C4-dicarboxylate transport system substrate-binding protein